ncbi:hypothetical protein [Sphingomonas montana]|uniref:hypothetical protein n=1 Tax=Sphingomonas montana TaxID=1843236 RepID=UPI0013ED008C|nr:hypothetical protein [Sphingomonas montana]
MRALSLLLILSPSLVIAAAPVPPSLSIGRDIPPCRVIEKHLAVTTRPAVPRKLGDLPPANQYLAVDRHVGGCRAPIMVGTGIGKR